MQIATYASIFFPLSDNFWTDLAALFAQSVFVKQVLCHAVLRSSHAAQVAHPVSQFFDWLHLLIKVVRLDEITQLEDSEMKSASIHDI